MRARIVDGEQPDPAHVALGRAVLDHALARDWPAVADAIAQVAAAGGRAVQTLLYGLADTHIAAHESCVGETGAEDVVQPLWVDVRTGQVTTDADSVPPGPRWAARWVTARALGDQEQCLALLAALHAEDAESMIDCVAALVDMCANAVMASRVLRAPR